MPIPRLDDPAFDRTVSLRDAYHIAARLAAAYAGRGDLPVSSFVAYIGIAPDGGSGDPAAPGDFLAAAGSAAPSAPAGAGTAPLPVTGVGPQWRVGGRTYALTLASDVAADAIALELDDITEAPRVTVADVRLVEDRDWTVSSYRRDLPLELLEGLIREARRRLPPVAPAG